MGLWTLMRNWNLIDFKVFFILDFIWNLKSFLFWTLGLYFGNFGLWNLFNGNLNSFLFLMGI